MKYDIVFADPPYEIVIRRQMLEALANIINPGGALVLEQSRRQPAEPSSNDLEMVYNRNYGDSKLIIYNKVIWSWQLLYTQVLLILSQTAI